MVDVELLRDRVDNLIDWTDAPRELREEIRGALTELEQLRAENAEQNHVIAQNQATCRANTAELRMRAVRCADCSRCGAVNSLPVCSQCWHAITHADDLRAGLAALVDHDAGCVTEPACGSCAYCDAVRLLGREPTASGGPST